MRYTQSMFTWWEYKGKKKKPPENLVYRKTNGLDCRFKTVKEFLKDENWVYKSPLEHFYMHQLTKRFNNTIAFNKGNATVKFVRYGELDAKK